MNLPSIVPDLMGPQLLEQRWAMLLQMADFGVWDLDPRSQTVHYSPEWKAALGYDSTDKADSIAVWRNRVHPNDLPGMLDALSDHLSAHADKYESEFRLRAADGSYRWVLSRGRVVGRDGQGKPLRMIGTLMDVTDRREAEALRTARDLAEAASRAKTEFLARMGHELRTPLNAVLGFAQLLALQIGEPDLESQRRSVTHIEDAGWYLLKMINDVLDLSRAQSGQLLMQIEPVPLEPLLLSACKMLEPLAQRSHVKMTVAPLPANAQVLADPVRVKQVLLSLLGNAIKYNREGGTVRIDAVADPMPEAAVQATTWRVSVTDTGIGISPEQVLHLFEPFNRLGRAGANAGGVGVGLVLAGWLVEMMGGRISVRSTLGVGSSFEVTLPAAPDSAPAPQ